MNSDVILEFGGEKIFPDIRKIKDMKEVIYDLELFKTMHDRDLYYMYRDLAKCREDRDIIVKNGLRYDITTIPPYNMGEEFVKTAGHYHPLIKGTEYTYPEVYEVLDGEAHYILQKLEKDVITDCIFIEAKEGDKVIIPPNYGHVTINPSNKELKMANWVFNDFSSIYGPYKKYGGAAYFELRNKRIIQNKNYGEIPEIRHIKPVEVPEMGFYRDKDMYNLIQNVKNLYFLIKPHKYDWLWELVLNI